MKPLYKRILLKLSGEGLMGDKSFGMSAEVIKGLAEQIKEVRDSGNYIVDAAPRRFSEDMTVSAEENIAYYKPVIYGKNANTAETLIFGRVLSENTAAFSAETDASVSEPAVY